MLTVQSYTTLTENELEAHVNRDDVYNTSKLDPIIGNKIYDQIMGNLVTVPPFCVVIGVEWNETKFMAKTEYVHENLLKRCFDNYPKSKHI